MPHYLLLGNWTVEGVRNVKQAPHRAEEFHKAVEAAGGKVLIDLHTMGQYDFVSVVELPSDDVLNTLALRSAQQGFVRTTTLKGWSASEFASLVRGL